MCLIYPCWFFKQSLRTVILELTPGDPQSRPSLPSGGAGSHYQLQGLRLQPHVMNNDHLSALHSAVHELHFVSFFQDLPDRHHRDKKKNQTVKPWYNHDHQILVFLSHTKENMKQEEVLKLLQLSSVWLCRCQELSSYLMQNTPFPLHWQQVTQHSPSQQKTLSRGFTCYSRGHPRQTFQSENISKAGWLLFLLISSKEGFDAQQYLSITS